MQFLRYFNTEGQCCPDKHYMVRLNERLDKIRRLFVDRGKFLSLTEADSASNNQVFIDFLAILRRYYIDRENSTIFHLVILVGVYDIKNLKLKLRPDGDHQYNSPWNIAARFHIDMGFSVAQIAQMLQEYESDRQTGMDICAVSECIYAYTGGYPFLVSVICKFLDEAWQAMYRPVCIFPDLQLIFTSFT